MPQTTAWHDDFLTLYWHDQYTRREGPESFSAYDPDRVCADLLSLRADIYVIYAVSQMGDAYYPSRILRHHPALGGRDYVGEMLSRLKEAGKRVVLYANWGADRPEWQELDREGNYSRRFGDIPYYLPCLNSPQREVMHQVTEELAQGYDCDGFSLDMFLSLEDTCTCSFCQPHLQRLLGQDGPVTVEDIARHRVEFLAWQERESAAYLARLNEILLPRGIVPFHNGFNPFRRNMGLGWRQHLDPYVTEIYSQDADLTVKLHQAMKRTSCALITSTPNDFAHTSIALPDFLHHAAGALGSGGRILGVCGVGARPDTTTSRRMLDNVRETLSFYREHADIGRGAEPDGEAAIVFSFATRRQEMAGGSGDDGVWSNQSQCDELFGLCRLLQEEHLPCDMLIPEVDGSLEALRRYRLLVLPAVSCMTDDFAANLLQYVKEGGRVLATGAAGSRDEDCRPRADNPLAEMLGARFLAEKETGSFYVEDDYEPLAFFGPRLDVEARGRVLRRILPPGADRSVFSQVDILPGPDMDGPALVDNSYGRGASLYAAFEPGSFYYRHGHYQTRELLASMLQEIYPESGRLVSGKMPGTVELSVTRQASSGRRIVHLLNRSTGGHYIGRETNHNIHEVIPLDGIEVRLRGLRPGSVISLRDVRGSVQPGEPTIVKVSGLGHYGAIIID